MGVCLLGTHEQYFAILEQVWLTYIPQVFVLIIDLESLHTFQEGHKCLKMLLGDQLFHYLSLYIYIYKSYQSRTQLKRGTKQNYIFSGVSFIK